MGRLTPAEIDSGYKKCSRRSLRVRFDPERREHREQFRGLAGFLEDGGKQVSMRIDGVDVRRLCKHRNPGERRIRLQLASEVDSIEPRHEDVGNDGVRRVSTSLLERLHPIGRRHRLEAVHPKDQGKDVA